MPNQWDDETKRKMSESHRKSWSEGTRLHPITKLKEEKLDLQARMDKMEKELAEMRAELDELKRWKGRVQETASKHRDLMEKGARKDGPAGDMCRDLLDVLVG